MMRARAIGVVHLEDSNKSTRNELRFAPGIAAGRLGPTELASNYSDLHPPLNKHEVLVEAERCYFCYDAPCQQACPTSIDIPLFIREIASGSPLSAAQTILSANIFGGMCARVCPTETLCEEVCVREMAEGKPVKIGLLQRHATDALLADGRQIFVRAPVTGKRIAVAGGGPAGLACAHKLAELGHSVTVFEARERLAGLNEYGIAAYKVVDSFAQREVDFILSIGGITVKVGTVLGRDVHLADLRRDYDAVFLGLGLAGVNKLGLAGEDLLEGVVDAVDYIARLRQAPDLAAVPVGRRVVVIGGGMTAIDVAVQAKRLGAEEVAIVYRRGPADMKASAYEQELAQNSGVTIRYWARPVTLEGTRNKLSGVTFERTQIVEGQLLDAGEAFHMRADMVFTAIGQTLLAGAGGGVDVLEMSGGRLCVDAERRTSLRGVWAGGDCIAGGMDLTVSAVEDGKQGALSIDRALRSL
jgi:dihydropyrimidine dehydrogenase (NAD+) subunit PreT